MRRLSAPSGNKALLEFYKPVEKTAKHERLSSVHLNAEVPQHTAHQTENLTAHPPHMNHGSRSEPSTPSEAR